MWLVAFDCASGLWLVLLVWVAFALVVLIDCGSLLFWAYRWFGFSLLWNDFAYFDVWWLGCCWFGLLCDFWGCLILVCLRSVCFGVGLVGVWVVWCFVGGFAVWGWWCGFTA